jgi:hypothetical protein
MIIAPISRFAFNPAQKHDKPHAFTYEIRSPKYTEFAIPPGLTAPFNNSFY